jgi:hypothetical protein
VLSVQHDEVVQAFSTECPDDTFADRVRARRSNGRGDAIASHPSGSLAEAEGVAPTTGDLEQSLVHPPLASDSVAVFVSRVQEPWCEGLHLIGFCDVAGVSSSGRLRRCRPVYACRACGRHATNESASLIAGHRSPRDSILPAVRYHLQLDACRLPPSGVRPGAPYAGQAKDTGAGAPD